MKDLNNKQNYYLTLWLRVMCAAIICMIFIGGLTRLTDSGLSITEWKPVTGILPPLNEAAWISEFDKYKQTPEYIQINNNMNLAEFKSIFWLEFIHRIAGRITGILYIFPLIYFLFNKTINSKKIYIYLIGLILLISQGIAGWYMVKSGLISAPCVSHFRLAIHLLLAIALYGLLFWQLMRASFYKIPIDIKTNLVPLNIGLNICLILLFIQITFVAFVAGLDAGLVYNQFPLMGDSIIPNEITSGKFGLNSFYDPVFVQFIHRMLAYIVTIAILVTCLIGLKIQNLLLSKSLVYLIITLILQIMVGILTLIYLVPIILALLHQIGAVILLSTLLWVKYLAVN
jgi:cytochrome c oxidase assembly protein subunit 15